MPKVKPRRSLPVIDMTAMVDVAFLLLTFFILTTKFRAEEKVAVVTPSSISDTPVPDQHVMTTTIDDEGRLYIGFKDQTTRRKVLDLVIEYLNTRQPGTTISPLGQSYFMLMPQFGVAFEELPVWLNMSVEEMKEYPQRGIPYPYTKAGKKENQLKNWILFATYSDPKMKFAIKGDSDTPVPSIQDAVSTFQDWNINKFYLITDLEGAPADIVARESAEE